MADRPIFYVDRCLGKAVAAALVAAGAEVRVHDDYFPQDSPDVVWIPDVAARGWVILTKDKNIRHRHGEREAAILSEARIFTLSSGGMRGPVMAAIFVKHLEAMELMALALVPPFLAIVGQDGVEVVYPTLSTDPLADKSDGGTPQPESEPSS